MQESHSKRNLDLTITALYTEKDNFLHLKKPHTKLVLGDFTKKLYNKVILLMKNQKALINVCCLR